MSVEMSGFDEMQENINESVNGARVASREGNRESAEELLKKIQATAPVDTGEYVNDWHIDETRGDDDEIYIVNTVDHGPYLVFPNSRMVGSSKADAPGRGIIHNVRGIVHRHSTDYRQNFIQKILEKIF